MYIQWKEGKGIPTTGDIFLKRFPDLMEDVVAKVVQEMVTHMVGLLERTCHSLNMAQGRARISAGMSLATLYA